MRVLKHLGKWLMLVALVMIGLTVPAVATPLAEWDALVPSAERQDNPFAALSFDQKEDLRLILRAEMAASNAQLSKDMARSADLARERIEKAGFDIADLFAERDLYMQRRIEADIGVTTTYLDQDVIMDGYALPLRTEAGRVTEFLLVPWVGACIHTPPPPPNQIVHVASPEGFEAVSTFTPIRLTGRLVHRPADYELYLVDGSQRIQTAYAMEQAVIGGTPGEIVSTFSAPPNMSSLASVQARITSIFTTAMTNIETSRSAATILPALLIAFAYGALHTLGPGHGKAVVISYFVGAGGSLRRGVVMGVRIAATHVLSALVVVFLLDFAVRQATGAAPSDYRIIRLGSYALITAIGAVLLYRALTSVRGRWVTNADGTSHSGCAACAASRPSLGGSGWIATAVGVVPCTGALIVMLFGLANNLVFPAVMMVIAISAGMALAMSALGVAAIYGRNWAEAKLVSDPVRRIRVDAGLRIGAAACVLLIGAVLLSTTITQHRPAETSPQAQATAFFGADIRSASN